MELQQQQQDACIHPVTQYSRNGGCGNHDIQQDIVELQQQAQQWSAAFGRDQTIRSEPGKAIVDLVRFQTGRVGVQDLPDFRQSQRMPCCLL